jgi:SanA protein
MTNNQKEKDKKTNRKFISFLYRHKIILVAILVFSIAAMLGVDFYVGSFSAGKFYYDSNDIPHKRAAVVLGCGKYFEGRLNLYYIYRINAAVELWQGGKIDAILVSGDNSRKNYDEPSSMKADLIDKGVPAEFITIDYAGFRTLDSIVRAREVFSLKDYIIVSQPFHCGRALYLARQDGQQAVGFCARDVKSAAGIKMRLREILARNKAVLDVLLNKKPKYLGKEETVIYRTSDEQQT